MLIFVVTVILGSVFVSCNSGAGSLLEFCTGYDEKSLEGKGCSTEQSANKELFLRIQSDGQFGSPQLTVRTYKVNGASETVDGEAAVQVSPEWGVFVQSLGQPEPGEYRITVENSSNVRIAEGRVIIK